MLLEAKILRGAKTKNSIILISLFLILFSLSCQNNPRPSENLKSRVDAYLNAHLKLKTFSGSVLMAKEGKILISKDIDRYSKLYQLS